MAEDGIFIVATGEAGKARLDQIVSDEKNLVEEMRFELVLALTEEKPPIVAHIFDDELDFACLCETLWPSPKIRKIRMDIEAERQATH